MKTAAINGTIYGNEWQTVYDSGELSSAATSITISNLDGDTDKEYRLITRVVNGFSGVGSSYLTFNGDTSTNYGDQELYGENTSVGATRTTPRSNLFVSAGTALGGLTLFDGIIYAKSGYVRTVVYDSAYRIAGTTVEGVMSVGGVWNNTASNLTSMTITAAQANGLGIGTRIILMRRADRDASTIGKSGRINAYGKIKGCFQKIYENTLSSAATSVTISSLNGNIDEIYLIKCRFVNGYSGTSAHFLRPNNDTSTSNYGFQRFYGESTLAAASRASTWGYFILGDTTSLGSISQANLILYAKSGYVRTCLNTYTREITGTTVTDIMQYGQSWNNTADNITSLVFQSAQTNGFGIGTMIELWAYRP